MVRYPTLLAPSDEPLEIDLGRVAISLPRAWPLFARPKSRTTMRDAFGNKPLVNVGGRSMFAELAIVATAVRDGWDARWVCTYGRPKMSPLLLTRWKSSSSRVEQTHEPIKNTRISSVLDEIAERNGKYGGCWDVVAWKGDRLLFLESKLHKHDRIQTTQLRWLMSALEIGLSLDDFVVVEWQYG